MTGEIERPLDFLNSRKGKIVLVQTKVGDPIEGKLLTFDIHINLVIEVQSKLGTIKQFIKGEDVLRVSE